MCLVLHLTHMLRGASNDMHCTACPPTCEMPVPSLTPSRPTHPTWKTGTLGRSAGPGVCTTTTSRSSAPSGAARPRSTHSAASTSACDATARRPPRYLQRADWVGWRVVGHGGLPAAGEELS